MASLETPSLADHEKIRYKYVNLAWQLWRTQYEQRFFVWHPIPEEHLRIEVVMFWRGEIQTIHGWNNIVGQIVDAVVSPIRAAIQWFWENVIRPGIEILLAGVKFVADRILGVVNAVLAKFGEVQTWIQSGIKWVWEQAHGFFSAIAEVLKQIGVWIINAIKTYVVDPFLEGLGVIFEGI